MVMTLCEPFLLLIVLSDDWCERSSFHIVDPIRDFLDLYIKTSDKVSLKAEFLSSLRNTWIARIYTDLFHIVEAYFEGSNFLAEFLDQAFIQRRLYDVVIWLATL